MTKEDVRTEVATVLDLSESDVTVKMRKGSQMKANALWEGSASPASPRTEVLVAMATNAPELAIEGAVKRLELDVHYPEAIAIAPSSGQLSEGAVVGYTDGNVGKRLAEAVGAPFSAVPRPVRGRVSREADRGAVDRIHELLQRTPNVILQGPPGTGKTRLALETVARWLDAGPDVLSLEAFRFSTLLEEASEDFAAVLEAHGAGGPDCAPVVWELIQFHPNYAYEDLVRGIRPVTEDGVLRFVVEDRLFPRLCTFAQRRGHLPVVLIIDEINRGNLSSVLGELMFGIDPAYRGTLVRLQYQGSGLPAGIIVPHNLYLIGTMNTADRSLAVIDYAARRRFRFVDVPASASACREWYGAKVAQGVLAEELFITINHALSEDLQIGHSYFFVDPEPVPTWAARMARQVAYHIAPQLSEYREEGVLPDGRFTWRATELIVADPRRLAHELTEALAAALSEEPTGG